MNKKIITLTEYFAESTTACLVTMVQGNLLALTVGHVLIASQTGVVAGAIASITILVAQTGRQWVISVVLGAATAVVDYFVHPGQFGPVAMEAVVTGLGAGLLSYLVGTMVRYVRVKRQAAN